jgi:p-aminobenzoyl-glutamate transporter AbgT
VLAWIERVGNRLPDPAMHFLIALGVTLAVSALLAGRDFGILDPRTGAPLQVLNQLSRKGSRGSSPASCGRSSRSRRSASSS